MSAWHTIIQKIDAFGFTLQIYDNGHAKVVSRGLAPQHSKSFATMNSMSNGSLLIYGGIVNKPNSLWMATINDNVVPMTATWKRLCCDDDKK